MSTDLVQPSTLASNGLIPSTRLDSAYKLRVLRLSITDLCNFRCRYCMPARGVDQKVPRSEVLPLERLAALTSWLTNHTGIEAIRITGGEPLVRPGIEHLITRLSSLPAIREVSLTTNGSMLRRMAWSLKAAGLTRVNISLDSLCGDRFAEITRGGRLIHTLEGIAAAKAARLLPIKINTVLLRSTWRQDIPRLLDFAALEGLEIRFIELMRTGTERAWCEAEFVSADEVMRELALEIVSTDGEVWTRSPARRTLVNWHGAPVQVGWIAPRSHPFCSRCERLRMDARGQLRRCLMDPSALDLSTLRDTTDEVTMREEFETYIAGKAPPIAMDTALAMREVGG